MRSVTGLAASKACMNASCAADFSSCGPAGAGVTLLLRFQPWKLLRYLGQGYTYVKAYKPTSAARRQSIEQHQRCACAFTAQAQARRKRLITWIHLSLGSTPAGPVQGRQDHARGRLNLTSQTCE